MSTALQHPVSKGDPVPLAVGDQRLTFIPPSF